MTPQKTIFSEERKVHPSEIDDLGHVNNVVYLQWVQDIASSHWAKLSEGKIVEDVVWVVLKHEIHYKSPAFKGDTIIVKTWVGATQGVTSIRHVEIYKEDTLLVTAQTTWCLLDAKSHRPLRINQAIESILLGN